jgi:DNA-binding transcriptional LysR family regulator
MVHLAPVRLAELGPLNLVLPGPANTRRQTLLTYFASNGVEVARTIELDAMMGTLDTVAGSDWVTVLPGVMMAAEVERPNFTVNPIASPPLDLDLVVIEPSRQTMKPAAAAFFGVLEAETRRLNDRWRPQAAGRNGVDAEHRSVKTRSIAP